MTARCIRDSWVKLAGLTLEQAYDDITSGEFLPEDIEDGILPEALETFCQVAALGGLPYDGSVVRRKLFSLFCEAFSRPPLYLFAVEGMGLHLAEGEEALREYRKERGYIHTDVTWLDGKSVGAYSKIYPGDTSKKIPLIRLLEELKGQWGVSWTGAVKVCSLSELRFTGKKHRRKFKRDRKPHNRPIIRGGGEDDIDRS